MESLKISFTLLSVVGIWKPVNCRSEFLYTLWRMIALPVPFFVATSQILRIILVNNEVDELSEIFFVLISIINICCKSISFLANRKNIVDLTNLLTTDIASAQDEEERKIQKDYRHFMWLFTIINLLAIESTAVTFCSQPFLDPPNNRTLPFKVWIPYNYSTSEKMFWITFAILTIMMFTCSFANVCTDTLMYGFLVEAGGQYDILKHRFSVMSECDPKSELPLILRNIQHHKFIFKYVDKFKKAFNSAITAQSMLSGLVITVCVYQLTISSKSMDVIFFRNLMYLIGMLAELFFYCWFSNELTRKSTEFLHEIFSSNWIKFRIQNKKYILFAMLRCCKPIVVTIGLSNDLSIELFMKVIKLSYTAFNVMRKSI